MNHLNNDLDDFGTELPDSYTYTPRGRSMHDREDRSATSSRQSPPTPLPRTGSSRPQTRQAAPLPGETRAANPKVEEPQNHSGQMRKDSEFRSQSAPRPASSTSASTTTDKRIRMFIGLLLIIVALLMAAFMLSHLKNGAADQSIVMDGGNPEDFSNIGGPVGATTSYFFVTRWFGIGSIAFLIYFALVGLSLLGVWKTKFWATTFQCLLIGITTSIVLGFVTFTWPTALSWGGEHGRFVNAFLFEYTGWPGALALSILLIGSIVIVYFNQIYAFYKARKAELDARRQRRQAAREEYERQRRAAEEALAKAKSEFSEKEGSTVPDGHFPAANVKQTAEVRKPDPLTYEDSEDTSRETKEEDVLPAEKQEEQTSTNATVSLEELEEMPLTSTADSEEKVSVAVISDVIEDSSQPSTVKLEDVASADNSDKTPVVEDPHQEGTPRYVIGIDEDEEEQISEPERTAEPVYNPIPSSQGFEIDDTSAEDEDSTPASSLIIIDEDDTDSVNDTPEETPRTHGEDHAEINDALPQSADITPDGNPEASLPSPAETPISVTVNEIEKVEQQSDLYDPTAELSRYKRPPLDLLADDNGKSGVNIDIEEQEENKQRIIKTLLEYGIPIVKIDATVGPTVTLFEIVPAEGVRIASIRRIEDDIARSLAAEGIRIIAPIPGKGTVGIEVPNHTKRTVTMRSVLSSRQFQESTFHLPVAMGTTVSNEIFIEDLAKMPHLLVAGATGQGKSVGLNAIISSLIYKKHPAELKFVLVDPKMVEFSLYNKLERHFLAKLEGEEDAIITDPEKVKATLNSLCIEMDNRYRLLKDAYVRSLEEYNTKFINRKLNPEHGHKFLPYIVVVVDEFADLIMMAGKEIEMPIARIAQKARAVGIHLIIATQRPSTNVITGMIKANFPARIAFKVSAMVDSKTILDRTGANSLIGKGDMLFSLNSKLERVQCAFISTEEVEAVCDWIDGQVGYEGAYPLPEYIPDGGEGSAGNNFGDRDSLFDEAARFVVASSTASTSALQRRYSIGYNRAGKIMDQMEAAGIVGPANGGKPRPVLVDSLTLERILENN